MEKEAEELLLLLSVWWQEIRAWKVGVLGRLPSLPKAGQSRGLLQLRWTA